MKKSIVVLMFLSVTALAQNPKPHFLTLSREELKDKIKGGWAGQTIGVTFGGPTEFRFNGTFIQDYQPIYWSSESLKQTFENSPTLYDDIYMDLTFVEILVKHGLQAPADSFAQAFAKADYALWHANQASRYNLLNGINPPESGHWLNNPHADDIDFQIEADFIGLMNPGLPQSASELSDKIGHIMNYGDGWYGGVYVANMYSLAFLTKDIKYVVSEALKSIPSESQFYQCINDVIKWHEKYPDDWKSNWFEIQKKWSEDIGCPDGVFSSFNIDAKINAAYVVLGLLYGKGDFTQTMEISTRAGQDSDCNPSTAGGILGVILGYENIPDNWKKGLKEIEDIDFLYTKMSLLDVYEASFNLALEQIDQTGGNVHDDELNIALQPVSTVRFEKSFPRLYPKDKIEIHKKLEDELEWVIDGTGFVISGETAPWDSRTDYVFEIELYVDDQFQSKTEIPVNFVTRSPDLFWKYDLPEGKHSIKIKLLNPSEEHPVRIQNIVVYGPEK